MTPERWQQIKDLFSGAITFSGSEREKFVAQTTAGDPELRREVESLLASSTPIDESALFDIAPFLNSDGSSFIGTNIGPYKVLREIGRGGMGIVYEGIREEEFKLRVAIKLVRSGLGTEETLRRFRAERSTLARLNHANIARLLDGGSLPDKTPYFVMEYVEGVPIDTYCDEKKLGIRERLDLFRTVCAAVQYAHQNLIIHRDLKPGNIFVTESGVKLLDFGIAKLLSGDSSDESIAQTQLTSRFFTPEYASPEQILGANVTTASDTYSLGVLLYKLLTGQRPYRFKSPSLRDVEQAITGDPPTKPSSIKAEAAVAANRSSSAAKLAKTLSGDLDTIVLKALQKEPERRYASIQQLDDDVRRHLAGLPVLARKDSFAYRLSKFVHRNKAAVVAFVIVNLAIIGGIGGVIWQADRATKERDRAQAESEKLKEVVRVLNEMLSAADLTRATKKDVTVAEVLEQASQRIEKDFGRQPEIAADLLATIGSTYQGLQLFDKAEAAKQKALQLQIQMHGSEHPKVAEALHHLGELYYVRENRSVAESLYAQSLAMFRKLNQPSREYAIMLNDYGVFVQDDGKYALADSLLLAALSFYRQVPGDNRKDLATSLHNLALSKDWQGQLTAADSLYRESLRIQRDVYGNNNVQMAFTIGNLGFIAEARRDFPEAERLFRESLAIRRSLLSDNHSDVAANKIKLGLFLVEHGNKYHEAEQLCREALDALIVHNPNLKRLVARAYLGIGRAVEKQGRLTEGEQALRKSVAHFAEMQPFNAKSIVDAELSLAGNLLAQGRFRDAETTLLHAQNTLKNASADSSDEMLKTRRILANVYAAWKHQ